MKNHRPHISVVIPTYNGVSVLKKNLPNVLSELRPGDEVVIIDDASTDSTQDFLLSCKNKYPELKWTVLVNKKNIRFGASCNRAVQQASYNYIWLLNNDVSPQQGCLEALLECMESHKNTFGIGCLEIEKDANEIGGKNVLWFERGLFVHARDRSLKTGETAWVSGGSGLFDKEKWLKIGGFDHSFYPAYWEDIDISWQARKNGWEVLFCAEARVNHNHETTNATAFGQREIAIMSVKNGLVFLWKNGSFLQKISHLVWMPYHLTITTYRTKGIFAAGWFRWLLGTMKFYL